MPVVQKTESGEDDLWRKPSSGQQSKSASVSLLQRKLRIGYSRAARLMELLEEKGIVGPDEGPTKGRVVNTTDDNLVQPVKSREPTARNRQFEEAEFADWTDEDWADLDKE